MKVLAFVALLSVFSFTALGSVFNPSCTAPCNETTTSLGMFILSVTDPALQAGLTGNPGYNSATHLFVSPLLYDSTTIIGLSTPYQDGSATYPLQIGVTGVTSGVNVTQVNEAAAPTQPSGFPAPGTNDEISTAILNVSLQGGGFAVNIGAAAAGTAAGGSQNVGEVESTTCNSSPGLNGCANNDFPAQSFFDVFADVTVPGAGTFHNSSPLVVQSTLPVGSSLPPKVLYTHGQSTTVNLVADTTAGDWIAGETVGTFMLTGHGVSYQDTPAGMAAFGQAFDAAIQADTGSGGFTPAEQQFLESAVNAQTGAPEPSTFVLLLSSAAVLAGFRKARRAR